MLRFEAVFLSSVPAFLPEREKEKLPNIDDVEGAAFGLVRLHSLYQFDLERFLDQGVIETTLDNGQKVESRPANLDLTSYDVGLMATQVKYSYPTCLIV